MEGCTDSRRNSTKGARTPAMVSANSSRSKVPPPSLSAASNIEAASPSDTTIPRCTNAPRKDFASMSGPPPISTNNSSTLTRISGVSRNSPYSSSTINTSESKRSNRVVAALPQVFAFLALSRASGEGSFFCTGCMDVSMGGGRGGLPFFFREEDFRRIDVFFFFFLPPRISLSADVIAASRCCRAAAASSSMILAAARASSSARLRRSSRCCSETSSWRSRFLKNKDARGSATSSTAHDCSSASVLFSDDATRAARRAA
mmetsp:Transcript_21318/g.63651  ORF Transcript_21318/g.63651 Transcript_21318/m.63651 type:complete len:260 (-) Transcript_21318:379-1158(-)